MKSRVPYELERIQRIRNEWLEANGPCQRCGSTKDLEIDHIDPSTKDPIARRQTLWYWSVERREAELAKCQVLCNPCHKKKSLDEQRVAECPKGHAMTPDNWYIRPSKPNVRQCRRCEYDITNRWKRKAKARSKAALNLQIAPRFVEFS